MVYWLNDFESVSHYKTTQDVVKGNIVRTFIIPASVGRSV